VGSLSSRGRSTHGAQQWDEAAKAAREFLALPDLLLADGAQELEGLLDQAQRALDVLPKAKRKLTRETDESLRPAWAHTVQSFLLGDDWSGEVISAIEKNYIDVSAFLYCTTSPVAEAMLPRVVLGYDYRGGFPVASAFKVLRAQVPHSYRSRTVGVAAMSPGILSIDARTEIAVTILESIAALEGAKPYYELVQAWAKQDPAKEPEIPKDAETHIRLLARALRVNPDRLLLPDADIHAVGKLLASYFRKLLRLARPPGEAEFLGVGPNVVPTEVCVGLDEED
jgi:hypothetical protein